MKRKCAVGVDGRIAVILDADLKARPRWSAARQIRDLHGEAVFAEAGNRLEALSVRGCPDRTGNGLAGVDIPGEDYGQLHRGWRRSLQRLRARLCGLAWRGGWRLVGRGFCGPRVLVIQTYVPGAGVITVRLVCGLLFPRALAMWAKMLVVKIRKAALGVEFVVGQGEKVALEAEVTDLPFSFVLQSTID